MGKRLLIAVMLAGVGGQAAANDVLEIDRAIENTIDLAFPNDADVHPKQSAFALVNYVLMSSESGERWAIVTLRNMSGGKRFFESGHLLALAGDGSRFFPDDYKESFEGGETKSLTLSFGRRKFPILLLNTEN